MRSQLPSLHKFVARSHRNYSACWELKSHPGLRITKHSSGKWVVFCDPLYHQAIRDGMPRHDIQSVRIDQDLAYQFFATRKDALQAIQVWLLTDSDSER